MDRKSITILVVCIALLVCMNMLVNRKYPPIPVPVSTNQTLNATSQTYGGTNTGVQSTGGNQVTGANLSNVASKFVVHPEIAEELQVVSNDNARYTFTSRGGGLKKVELFHYADTVSRRRQKVQLTNALATLNATSGPPVLAILGDESVQGDGVFKLTPTDGGMRAEKTLTNGLTVVKQFQLGTNYLMTVSVRLENHSRQAITIPAQEWVAGTATPMGPQDNGQAESVLWNDGTNTLPVSLMYFSTNTSTLLVFPRVPKTEYRAGNDNVVWASAQNQFFALVTMPVTNNPASPNGPTTNAVNQPSPSAYNTDRLPAAIVVRMVDLPAPSQDEMDANPRTVKNPKGMQAALIYPGFTLQPEEAVENDFTLFAGPKEYHTLAAIADRFNNNVDRVMGFNGFFGGFAWAMLMTMNWMHAMLALPYGWAIVVLTALIKLIFWPLTQYSTKSMKRMAALQPQIKLLQEKYKDDPAKFSQKQMEFWKKNKVNPLSGCLPMMVQIPVLGGFYRMLQSAIELRGQPFLWVGDLSKPDTLFSIPIPLHFLGHADMFFPVNPMPLLMGASMLWQSHLTPASPGMDPAQQKMMRYMPLIILLFLYNFSSGLALYWTVSNLLGILQTKMIRAQTDPAGAAKAAVPVAPQKKKK